MLRFRCPFSAKAQFLQRFLEQCEIEMRWKVLLVALVSSAFLVGAAPGTPIKLRPSSPLTRSNLSTTSETNRTRPQRRCLRLASGRIRCMRSRRRNGSSGIVGASSGQSKAVNKPSTGGGINKAGEFNGDVRTLPKTKPVRQEPRKPGEINERPRPAPTPAKTPGA
jgi:hypothetical protein